MSGQVPAIPGIELKNIGFPHFEFECTLTADERLIAPQFDFTTSVAPLEEQGYLVEVRAESKRDKPADFRALVVIQLAFSLPEQDPPLQAEEAERFLQVNSLVLAWPYIRELVSSATVRMGFPALLLPMLNVGEMYAKQFAGEGTREEAAEETLEKQQEAPQKPAVARRRRRQAGNHEVPDPVH